MGTPSVINRQDFFALTKLNTDAHTTLKRRDLIPVPNKVDRGYTPFEAFSFNLAERLVNGPDGHGMSRALATGIVRDALTLIAARGAEIEETGLSFRRVEGVRPILVGRVIVGGRAVPFCGTADELAEVIVGNPEVLDVMLTSATASFAVLWARAQYHDIDLTGMWPDPASFPAAEQRRSIFKTIIKEAVDKTNARRSGGSND
jgi:hypothetical protein